MFLSHFPAFQYRDFRVLWLSQLSSALTANFLNIAIFWQLYQLTHSAAALGIVGIVEGLPFLLLNLLGGNFADVHNRKRILYITEAVFALSSFGLAFATYFHVITPLVIYVSIGMAWFALAFDMPARHALLPSIVPQEHLASANSVYSTLWQAAMMVGPAVGGFLIAYIGVGNIYLFDAIATTIFIFGIGLLQYNGEPHGENAEVSIKAIHEGFTFLFSKNILWTTKLLDAVSVLFASSVILFPIYAKDILHVGPKGLGFLYAAPAIGGVMMGLFMSKYAGKIKKQGKWLLWGTIVYALTTILFGISTSFLFSMIVLAISGAANMISVTIRSTISQLNTPNHMLGRMDSLSSIFWMGGDKLGDVEGGFVAQLLGAPAAVVLGGVGALVFVGVMAIISPTLRNYMHEQSPAI